MHDIPPNITTVIVAILGSTLVANGVPVFFRWLGQVISGKEAATIESLTTKIELLETKMKLIGDSQMYVLQDRLLFLCTNYINREFITANELKSLTNMYKVYHELGGNDFITELFERAKELPIRKDKLN